MFSMRQVAPAAVGLLLVCGALQAAESYRALPPPRESGGMPLADALKRRQSLRMFRSAPVPDEVLSSLLWSACGINRMPTAKRTAPTAKNWQEIDVYVARPDGCFRYDAAEHGLALVKAEDLRAAAGRQAFVATAPLVLIYVADDGRMEGAGPEERTFYSAVDTGFVSQNVYLFCAAEGLATVVLGWVDREELARRMGLGPQQRVILTQPVGYMPLASAGSAPAVGGRWRDGEYAGRAPGYSADVAVRVRVEGGRVSGVEVTEAAESRPRTALQDMPARIVSAGGPEGVDAVTGATVTSRAILRAVGEALSSAR